MASREAKKGRGKVEGRDGGKGGNQYRRVESQHGQQVEDASAEVKPELTGLQERQAAAGLPGDQQRQSKEVAKKSQLKGVQLAGNHADADHHAGQQQGGQRHQQDP